MTEWVEITVENLDGEGAEAVTEALRRYVHQGVAVEQPLPHEIWPEELPSPGSGPLVVRAYIPNNDSAEEIQEKIARALGYLRMMYPVPEPSFRTVEEEDWADAWKQHYHPVRIGTRLLIKPAWIDEGQVEIGDEDIVIEMDPGMAFGTGTHPTTQLCLQACEWFARPATSMVDLGAGSGILAIAAAKLGCYKCLAVEIDEVACRAAEENVARNGVADIVSVLHGSLDSLQGTARHHDWAIANLTARIILDMAPKGLQHVVWPGGKFIFSGIIDEQAEEVINALDGIGLETLGQRQMGDWIMLITQRRPPE